MKYKAPRGTQDILPGRVERWQHLEEVARRIMERYGYREIRTPDFEDEELFLRTVGEETDIVAKEMYRFSDRKGRRLALRPEGTAPVIRSYIENALWTERKLQKLYYIGPMFRYDRPQLGRYRQFHQVGAEAVGSLSPLVDAEVIALMEAVLKGVGLKKLILKLNSLGDLESRAAYKKALVEYFSGKKEKLCADCRVRLNKNPLRILDCKVPECRALSVAIPPMEEYLSAEAAGHYSQVQHGLGLLGVAFEKDKNLVRGLDYYTRTAFEFHHGELGASAALGGGGRYDGLVAECGGPDTPGIGFSLGTERVLLALDQDEKPLPGEEQSVRKPGIYLVWLGENVRDAAFSLAGLLRRWLLVEMGPEAASLKSQLRQADKLRLSHALILGDRELAGGKCSLKDLSSGKQELVEFNNIQKVLEAKLELDEEKIFEKAFQDWSHRYVSSALSF